MSQIEVLKRDEELLFLTRDNIEEEMKQREVAKEKVRVVNPFLDMCARAIARVHSFRLLNWSFVPSLPCLLSRPHINTCGKQTPAVLRHLCSFPSLLFPHKDGSLQQ